MGKWWETRSRFEPPFRSRRHPSRDSRDIVMSMELQTDEKIEQPGDSVSDVDEAVSPQTAEEIEGQGDPASDVDEEVYPLDDIMVRSETRTVREVVRRINQERYAMDPDFQRDFVWDPKKQSKLIESCVMRIPLPVLYVAEGLDGRIVVVDGLQRLTTFVRFINDELTLTGPCNDQLKGKRFSQLPINFQERVEDTQLTLYILDKSAPQRAQLDIFERVNGGVALSRQQMRNALFNGPGTRWLKKISKSEPFLQATGPSLKAKIMRDREVINRFAGFRVLGWKSYDKGDMDDFLARTIERLNNLEESRLATLENEFSASMEQNYQLFDRHSFRKSLRSKNRNAARSAINIALFDVLSWAFSKIPSAAVEDNADEIKDRIVDLVLDEEFENAISYSTNSTVQVRTRFLMVEEELSDWIET